MFEFIFGVVCLGVLAVEIIEVRHKCEECYPGPWDKVPTFPLDFGEPREPSGAA